MYFEPMDVSCSNDLDTFCASQNVVNKTNLALYIFQGQQVPPLAMSAGALGESQLFSLITNKVRNAGDREQCVTDTQSRDNE